MGDDRMGELTSEWRTCCRTRVDSGYHERCCTRTQFGKSVAAAQDRLEEFAESMRSSFDQFVDAAPEDLRRQAGVGRGDHNVEPKSLLRLASEANEAAIAYREAASAGGRAVICADPRRALSAADDLAVAVDRLTGAVVEAENDG